MASEEMETEIRMDPDGLYREEVFTDRRVGTIQRLTRVDGDGNEIAGERPIFIGQTQLMTRAGPLPLNFEIPAATLSEAADKFGEGANQAITQADRAEPSGRVVPG